MHFITSFNMRSKIALFVTLVVILKCNCSNLFDYTEIDDPFSFIFNAKEQIFNKFIPGGGTPTDHDFWNQFGFGQNNDSNGKKCTSVYQFNIEPTMGRCLPRDECQKRGGKVEWSPSCTFFKTFCCIQKKSCGGQSSNTVSRFQSGFENDVNETCTFNLKVQRNVCQIRLDFNKFSIAPPRRRVPNEAYGCIDDVFRLVGYPNIPHLCGNNTGQHLYIPVKNMPGGRQRILQFVVDMDQNAPTRGSMNREWDIEMTQIECPKTSAIRTKRSFTPTPNHEYQLLAPKNCLQYFVAETGTIRSLNLNNNQGNFIGPMKYAVCFYSNAETCGYRFEAEYFRLSDETADLKYDSECDKSDYITIPEARNLNDNIQFNRICSSIPSGKNISIMSTTAGPYYLTLTTNGVSDATHNRSENGFSINYKRLHNGCE